MSSIRRGVALPITLGALAVIAALLAAAFFAASEELHAARAERLRAHALAVAESAIIGAIDPAVWDTTWRAAPPGLLAVRASDVDGVVDTLRIAKLSARSYLVSASATAGVYPMSFARRRIALLVVDSAGTVRKAGDHAWLELR
jgi:hypothetical protein